MGALESLVFGFFAKIGILLGDIAFILLATIIVFAITCLIIYGYNSYINITLWLQKKFNKGDMDVKK